MTTLTLQPAAGIDTFLYASAPTTNYGTDTLIYVGAIALNAYRGLLKFDLATLPVNAVIYRTTLSLYMESTYVGSGTHVLNVYRCKRAWDEAQATWNVYTTGNNWGTAGASNATDRESSAIGSISKSYPIAAGAWWDIPLTGTNKDHLELGYGWVLQMDTESYNACLFTSSDGTAAQRPKLVIEYRLQGRSLLGVGV